MVTELLFNRDEWLKYDPYTMIAGQLSGRYLAFYDTTIEDEDSFGALIIDAGVSPYLIRTDARASATFFEVDTGALYYQSAGTDQIFQIDAPNAARESMYWRSKEFDLNMPQNFGVILVRSSSTLNGTEQESIQALIDAIILANATMMAAGPIGGELAGDAFGDMAIGGDMLDIPPAASGALTVGIIADGVRVAQVAVTNKPRKLPSGFKATKWEVDVAGDRQVREILLAKTMQELQAVPTN